jgi:flagellar biosynthesis GTPase FlhF
MRFYVIITLLCVTIAGVASQDHLGTLGISEGRAKEAVFDSFMADAVSLAGRPAAFTAMAPAARVALVNFALTLARTFVESDDFKRRYADHRDANGPDPLPEAQTADSVLAKQRDGFEQQVAEMRKMFDQITPEQRATLEQGWKQMRDQMTAMEKGERRKEIDGLLKDQRAGQVRAREEAMTAFEKTYPADPRALVALRLRRFLDVTKDVDFAAQLVDTSVGNGKRRVFADPALEARPGEWKMAFRAGKPATDAARTFAQKWLSDLQSQGVR